MANDKFITASEYPFLKVRFDRDDLLFAVRPGVLISNVLQQASDYLEAAHGIAYENADEIGVSGYSGAYLIELAKGLVDAAIDAVAHTEVSHA